MDNIVCPHCCQVFECSAYIKLVPLSHLPEFTKVPEPDDEFPIDEDGLSDLFGIPKPHDWQQEGF